MVACSGGTRPPAAIERRSIELEIVAARHDQDPPVEETVARVRTPPPPPRRRAGRRRPARRRAGRRAAPRPARRRAPRSRVIGRSGSRPAPVFRSTGMSRTIRIARASARARRRRDRVRVLAPVGGAVERIDGEAHAIEESSPPGPPSDADRRRSRRGDRSRIARLEARDALGVVVDDAASRGSAPLAAMPASNGATSWHSESRQASIAPAPR